MTARESIDRLATAVTDRQDAVFDAVKGANERYHRFVRSMIEGTRQGVHDWTGVAHRWTERPTDIVGLYESASEAFADGQARSLALWQELLEDLAESQRESREAVRRGFGEMREAVERVTESAPSFLRARVPSLRRDGGEPVAKA